MEPHQIISLMNLGGPSFAMPDHWDHIHVGYYPRGTGASPRQQSKQFASLLKAKQWQKLIGRLSEIKNPRVPTSPSRYSLPANHGKHARGARRSGD
jgi:hypothetical protein